MKHRCKPWLPAAALAGGAFLVLLSAFGQVSPLSKYLKAENFKAPLSYYEGQYQGQARAVIMGKEARVQPDGKTYLIKEMKLETYRETGARELLVLSPDCLFNNETKVANSAGQLQLQTVDEHQGTNAPPVDSQGLFIEGVGFEWDQGRGRLVISNQVHTVLHRELFKAEPGRTNAPPAPGRTNVAPPLEIFSRATDISITNRIAVYTDNVKVIDPRTEITCALLTIRGMTATNNQIESVVAEHDVAILNKQDNSRATGEKAVYTATNNVVKLTGNPAIESVQGRMYGDEVILYRDQNELASHGNVRMNMVPGSATNSAAPRQPLQLFAADARVNLTNHIALYTGSVLAEDPKMQLTCDWLRVEGAEKGGGVGRIFAKQKVTILNKEDQSRATGDEGVYIATNGIVTLTGNPMLENSQGKMFADTIVLHRLENELFATDHVKMELHSGAKDPVRKSGAQPRTPGTNAAPLLLFADAAHVNLTNRLGVYTGHVSADDSKMLMGADKLTVKGAPGTNRIETLVAEGTVVMTNRQDHSRATGDKGVYQADADIVTLTGNPMLENDQGRIFGDLIVLNRAQNILNATGSVRTEILMRGKTNSPVQAVKTTNQAPELMLVSADAMTANTTNRLAVFTGGVRVESSRMLMFCEEMTVTSVQTTNGVKGTNTIERVVAAGKVVIVNKLDGTRASGASAVYTAATDSIELTGDPTIERAVGNVTVVAENMVIWDRANNTLRAVGKSWSTLNPRAFQGERTKTNAPSAKAR